MSWMRAIVTVGIGIVCLAGCQSGQRSGGPIAIEAGGEGTAPPSHYRQALLADAMRGLRYDGGRVEIDEPVAATIVRRGPLEEALAEHERGEDLLRRNMRIQAIKAHTRAVLIAPDEPILYEGLGLALLAKGKTPEAVAAFRTALDLEPGLLEARWNLAQALQRQRRFEEAAETFRLVISQDPDHGLAHARLAVVLYYLNDDVGAWTHVRQAEALGAPVPPQFRELLARRTAEPEE